MSSNVSGITDQILRNLGAPIILAEVDQQTEMDTRMVLVDPTKAPEEQTRYRLKWVQRKDPIEGTVIERRTHLTLNNNSLAAIEGFFGSMDTFQKTLQERQFEAVRVAYAAALGFDVHEPDDVERVGSMLIGEHGPTYAGALQVALAMANGVDPTQAVGLWNETMISLREGQAEAAAALDEMLVDAAEERRQMQTMSEEDQIRLKAMKPHEIEALTDLRPKEKAALVAASRTPNGPQSGSRVSTNIETSAPPSEAPTPGASEEPPSPTMTTLAGPQNDSSASVSTDVNSATPSETETTATPGSDGSGSGSASAEPTTSSGA